MVELMQVNLSKIRRLRKGQNLSQEKTANLIGFKSVYSYHRKESGVQSFSAEEIHAIAKFFDKPIEYFFDEKLA